MAAQKPSLDMIAEQLTRMSRLMAGQAKQIACITKRLAEIDQKLGHVIHRLPDDLDSTRHSHSAEADSDSPLDTEDD